MSSIELILKYCRLLLNNCWLFESHYWMKKINLNLKVLRYLLRTPTECLLLWTQDMLAERNYLIIWNLSSGQSAWWYLIMRWLLKLCFSQKDSKMHRHYLKKWCNCISLVLSSCRSKIIMISVWEQWSRYLSWLDHWKELRVNSVKILYSSGQCEIQMCRNFSKTIYHFSQL